MQQVKGEADTRSLKVRSSWFSRNLVLAPKLPSASERETHTWARFCFMFGAFFVCVEIILLANHGEEKMVLYVHLCLANCHRWCCKKNLFAKKICCGISRPDICEVR